MPPMRNFFRLTSEDAEVLHISWKSVETPILIPYFLFMFSLISLPVLVGALGGSRTLAVLLPYSCRTLLP